MLMFVWIFFFRQKTAYEMRIRDWSSDVCSSDLDRSDEPRHGDMPRAWGVMGLYAGEGFADQVGEAAALLGTTPERVKRNPAMNILAAAVLLDRELRGTARDDEALAQALQRYAGFGTRTGDVEAYARASFAFDVLIGLDRGVDDNGIRVRS